VGVGGQCKEKKQNMRKLIIIGLLFLSNNSFSQIVNGYYEGLEQITDSSSEGQWYFLDSLSIRNDSAYLIKRAIMITSNDTINSISDYGFYHYAGLISRKENKDYISMFLTDCDYCIRWSYNDSLNTYIDHYKDTLSYQLFSESKVLIFNNIKYNHQPEKDHLIMNLKMNTKFIRRGTEFETENTNDTKPLFIEN
jgi:hypothetical protein